MIHIEHDRLTITIEDMCPLERLGIIQHSLIDVLTMVEMVDDGCMIDTYKHSIAEVLSLVQAMSLSPDQLHEMHIRLREAG